MEHKTGFEWHYEKMLHSWQEGLTEWVATIPTKYWVLLGVAGVTIILILCLPLFSSKKEEEVFTPPPIEPWPEVQDTVPDEALEETINEESDEYRDMEIAAMVNLKREMAREKEDLELETRKQKVAQQESEAKVKNVEANMRAKFGL